MSVQVSNCYYHPDKGTVGICAKCGVGICRECAVKDDWGKIVCRQCANEEWRQKEKELRKQLKARGGMFATGQDFVVPGIIGLLMVVVVQAILIFADDGFYRMALQSRGVGVLGVVLPGIIFSYMFFSMPFCYLTLSHLIPSYYSTTRLELVNTFKFWFKLLVTIFFGWLVFTFLWIRFLIRKNKNSKT